LPRSDRGTYGDLIAHTNMHATFELDEQPNDQFRITWKISVMRGERHDGLLCCASQLLYG
jgi:hypothetical protein